MPQRAITVANYLIGKAFESGQPITPLSLQKLLYFLHGYAYSRLGQGAVTEPFHAWKYGPVIPSLYRHLALYGGGNITDFIADPREEELRAVDPNLANVADRVWDAYGKLDGSQLVKMTHAPNGPWDQVYDATDRNGQIIPNDAISQYFVEREQAAAR